MNSNMNNMGMASMAMNNMPGVVPMGGGNGMGMNGGMGGGMAAMNPMNMGMNPMASGSGMPMGSARPGNGINPSQLMGLAGGGTNGMGIGGGAMNAMNSMGPMGGLNPAQILQQQQQRERDHQMSAMQHSHIQQQQRGAGMGMGLGGGGYGMNNMNGMGMGGNYGSMNPSAMSSSPTAVMGIMGADRPNQNVPMGNQNLGAGMGGMMGSQQHPMQSHPQPNMSSHNPNSNPSSGSHLPSPQLQQMLNSIGVTMDRFQVMSTQEKSIVGKKLMAMRGLNNQSQQNLQPSAGPLAMSSQGAPSSGGGNFYDQSQGRGFADQRVSMSGGPAMDHRPGSSTGLSGLGGDAGMGMGIGGNMMPPPPRPSTAMSNRSASGMGMPSQSSGMMNNMGMNNINGMSGMSNAIGGMGNMVGLPNMSMSSGMGLSRPGTSMGMRSNMNGMNMGPMGMGMNSVGGINHPGMIVAYECLQGMSMPRLASNGPGGVNTPSSSGVPGSPGAGGMRPPSRAMNVTAAGGGGSGNELVNGYPMPPNTPKHPPAPGTPQMGHAHSQPHQQGNLTPQHHPQNMHQGSPPPHTPSSVAAPGSPNLGGARHGSPMHSQSGRGTPNPLKRKASGLESPKMGPPSEVPSHGHINNTPSLIGAMDRPSSAMQNGVVGGKPPSSNMNFGMSLARPGTASGFSPSTPASASTPGASGQQLENIQGSFQLPPRADSLPPSGTASHGSSNSVGLPAAGTTSKPPRLGSMPPSTGGVNNASADPTGPTATSQAAAGMVSGSTPIPNGPVKVVPKLPPLPANVNLNPLVTEVKVVPLSGSDKAIPQLSQEEIDEIKRWQKVDSTYEAVFKAMREKMDAELKGDARYDVQRDFLALLDAGEFGSLGGKAGVFGSTNYRWWEKGSISQNPGAVYRSQRREPFDIRYPGKNRRDSRGKKGIKREGFKIPRRLNLEEANRPEQLVPIRLEFDVDHHKYRDTFVWNLNDPVVTPEIFAQTVVEDYQLAPTYHSTIVKNIQEQLSDYKAHSALYDGEGGEYLGEDSDPSSSERGVFDEKDAIWWENWRKRLRTEYGFVKTGKGAANYKRKRKGKDAGDDADMEDATNFVDEKPMTVEELGADEGTMIEDMRIVIKLDIIVGSMKLDDQFEWDIDNVKASPEQFAEVYTRDLGLSGEFRTAIAHSIREQVQAYQKSLFLVGRPSDGSIQDEDLRSSFLPSLAEGARSMDQVKLFTPVLDYLSDGELERNEKERDKDMNRRRKRNTRGRRGVNLPDREPIRTFRTPAIGFPELDAATLALAAAANAPVSRRAAAAAASLTIANMVASENGTPLTPLTMPSVPQPAIPTVVKEKKVKGLFKSPPVPPSALHPRAKIIAPTPSTSADVSSLPAPLENDPPPSITIVDKTMRPPSTRKAKDLEREAKDREYIDGQHANFIDGVWHCSNCGCPENIAIGRRKGPLGDKSQCGDCGKYWHRHRRPRPCTYNTDPDFHTDLKREDVTKSSKKKGAAAALRAQGSSVSTPAADDSSAPPTPSRDRKKEGSEVPPSRRLISEEDRAMSPISTASSSPEPPLSQRVKITNGTSSAHPASPPSRDFKDVKDLRESKESKVPDSKDSVTTTKNVPASTSTPPRLSVQSPPTSPTKPWPPPWLTTAIHATQTKYPNDKFDAVLRKVGEGGAAEWRIKCLDCPGKLYKPGPGEALSNFEVHLKNRQHRQRVDDRVAAK
ncbi:hypothetical protein D9757_000812 [Collybiopsis confluens]|uniref:SNF5-domain-containing protein n=1 Tax=Collybiopsis confluens TaxID=2823264 RepID=A0A8H5I0H1_9AGAR|nr:hypothetical protein D9757_000812 [Collybiopsis confluens]